MSRIRWTTAAVNDFKAISLYIERQRSIDAANKVCRTIYNAIQILSRFPESGHEGLEPGTLELVIAELPAYIVAYRLLPGQGCADPAHLARGARPLETGAHKPGVD